LGVLPKHYKLWWQNGRGLQTGKNPAHPKVSLSRPTATGGRREYTQNYSSEGIILMRSYKRSAKTGWQCGQHAKHNLRVDVSMWL
jgi:hypothetical protein